jgi:SAM-dependent methyltransferase
LAAGEAYRRIFDFGCGCGRTARQLFLQKTLPERYVGIDINAEMIDWCRRNLRRPGVEAFFYHHDVWSVTYAPRNSRRETLPLQQYGSDFTLVNAHSVFTHLYERQTEFYLAECRRMITSTGLMRTTWFFFNEDWFPILSPQQHTIFVNDTDPTQAVYYGWRYFTDLLRRLQLKIVHVIWTRKPGFQNDVYLAAGKDFVDLAARLEPPETILGFGPGKPPPHEATG